MTRLLPACMTAIALVALVACSPQTPPASDATAAAPEAVEAPPEEGGHAASLVPTISCGADSMLNANTTKASLIAAHGAENVVEQKVPWVDSEINAVVLFPNDPSMRAEVLWFEDTNGPPDAARVSGGPDSLWVGPGGLLLGSGLSDVEAANGGPFMMTAFENHNNGEVSNFLGGKLEGAPGDSCFVHLAMDAGTGAPEAAVAALSGDSEKSFRSDSAEVRAVIPVVVDITISFAR